MKKAVEKLQGIERRGMVLAFLMRFKQICNHPSQWLGDGSGGSVHVAGGAQARLCPAVPRSRETEASQGEDVENETPMTRAVRLRLFLDSNVLTGGILAPWGLDKAVLSLCAARICRMVLAEVVRQEVETNLLSRASSFGEKEARRVVDDYLELTRLARPEIVAPPSAAEVVRSRALIRHEADVPVLLSAIQSRPDWFLTHNRKHFSPAVARKTRLRIATPVDFFRSLASV
jgi:predicted nucleic acid-binding protein